MAEPSGPDEAVDDGSIWPGLLFFLAFLALMVAVVVASFWAMSALRDSTYAAVGGLIPAAWLILAIVVAVHGFGERRRKRREALEELSKLPIEAQRRIMVDVFFGLGRKDRR